MLEPITTPSLILSQSAVVVLIITKCIIAREGRRVGLKKKKKH